MAMSGGSPKAGEAVAGAVAGGPTVSAIPALLALLAVPAAMAILAGHAPAGEGGPAAPVRPEGVQVWTCDAPARLTAFDVPPPDARREIRLVGIRNARFSGQIVLASGRPIRGVKVRAADLAAAEGKGAIPAGRIAIRFAMPGDPAPRNMYVPECRFDALLSDAPKEVPVRTVPTDNRYNAPKLQAGAMLPVWVTVNVPAGAAPGEYRGKVTVEAEGLAATDVPVSIKVHAWTMPEPKDYTCRNNIWQSHESSALYYGVPLWSEKHFELMGRVLEQTRRMGNGLCVVHLIKGAYHQGNSESMVRWVKKDGGGYEHDFSIFEKYLDVYGKALGRPNVLLLTVYHPYVDTKDKEGKPTGFAAVSLLDRAAGRIEDIKAPPYGTAEAAAFWKPVLDGAFERIRKRGWQDAVVIGTSSDNGPKTPAPYDTLKAIWPDCRIMFSGHPRPGSFNTGNKEKLPVTCAEHVWAAGTLRKTYPWPVAARPASGTFAFSRAGAGMCHLHQDEELFAYRANPEMCLQCGQNGIGRVGADFWPVGARKIALSGDSGMHLGPSASVTAFVAPGPDGPVPTTRLEMFVEGMQVREALGFLLGALADRKLDPSLAARCGEYLNARAAANLPFQPKSYNLEVGMPYRPDWQEQDERLFALCAEVASAMGLK
ncbi:MAG: DUF4091 domain-containing protein [Planctomycetota bacterium]|nr:DUF4091 domain-containing protein [Planctomycetota bacterium]